MSFLKKNGQQKWVKEVKGRKYIPGYWYTYVERVSKYVPSTSGGNIYGAKPDIEERSPIYIYWDWDWDDKGYSQLIVDY